MQLLYLHTLNVMGNPSFHPYGVNKLVSEQDEYRSMSQWI